MAAVSEKRDAVLHYPARRACAGHIPRPSAWDGPRDGTRVPAGDDRSGRAFKGVRREESGRARSRHLRRNSSTRAPASQSSGTWITEAAIEIFDLLGYHPETSEELLPVTPEIVDRWKAQQAQFQKPPPPWTRRHIRFSTQRREDRTFGTLPGRMARSNSLTAPASTRGRARLSRRSRETSRTSDYANDPKAGARTIAREQTRAGRTTKTRERNKRDLTDRKRGTTKERRARRAGKAVRKHACDELAANPNDQNGGVPAVGSRTTS